MNVCIITLPRTGGTNFANWISHELNLRYIHEPLINKHHVDDKTVVKYIDYNFTNKQIEEKITEYDYSIVHIRKNTYEQARSKLFHDLYKKNMTWHEPYKIQSDFEITYKKDIFKLSQKYKELNQKLIEINSNIITTYEEIFENGLYEKVGHILQFDQKNTKLLDKKNRYFCGYKNGNQQKLI